MKILCVISMCVCCLYAQNELVHIMQNMEYAINLMEKGFLYNKKAWINEGLKEFKILNKELKHIAPRTYLNDMQRHDVNVVERIISRNEENIEILEMYLKKDEMLKSIDAYGYIVSGCVSCHAITRGW